MTKISIEKRVYSKRIGSEKPISTFQSRIACGQNPMVEHPSNPFPIHYLKVKKKYNKLSLCKKLYITLPSIIILKIYIPLFRL